jgi:hypothetical protein
MGWQNGRKNCRAFENYPLMLEKLKIFKQIWQNMGWRYVQYRLGFEFKKRTGLLKRNFPTQVSDKVNLSLESWKKSNPKFFFESKESLMIQKNPTPTLKEKFDKNSNGIFTYFSVTDFELGKNYNWLTNPDNGYQYTLKHWLDIPDFSEEIGDIKYVWEKSRFSYLYNIIRYDYHFEDDQAEFVFNEIQSWIEANPINQGPNWRCSQEISLRVLNWVFALHYYKNSKFLTEVIFQKVIQSIYWQMHHVYANIDFSRIAVRNNHAITETLALYLIGLLFPDFPDAKKWKSDGKKWFEEEIAYQVYDDGTFLQFSMNYHRVLIQLFTWAFYLAEKNQEEFNAITHQKAEKSLKFLQVCQDETSGNLPNYGANDGALFFPLAETDYRDYRSQLNALHYFFKKENYVPITHQEDVYWFIGKTETSFQPLKFRGTFSFEEGGYYVIKEEETMTFIRCGNHKDRPSQSDNLHLDIWVKGENMLRDAGSFKYNTDKETLNYFMGTRSHNTIMINDENQMKKGPRFVWLGWSQAKKASLQESETYTEFEGIIHAFKHLESNVLHKRIIRKQKNQTIWEITDMISSDKKYQMKQLWNFDAKNIEKIGFESENTQKIVNEAYYSGYYGQKEIAQQVIFETNESSIQTKVSINK